MYLRIMLCAFVIVLQIVERVNGLHLKRYFQPRTLEVSQNKTNPLNNTHIS